MGRPPVLAELPGEGVLRIEHVVGEGSGDAAAGDDVADDGLGLLLALPVGQLHLGAAGGQQLCRHFADAARSADDQGALPLEFAGTHQLLQIARARLFGGQRPEKGLDGPGAMPVASMFITTEENRSSNWATANRSPSAAAAPASNSTWSFA